MPRPVQVGQLGLEPLPDVLPGVAGLVGRVHAAVGREQDDPRRRVDAQLLAGHGLGAHRRGPGNAVGRITSYNVCYTKLLRTAQAARDGALIAHQVHGAIGVTDEHALHQLDRHRALKHQQGALHLAQRRDKGS